MIIIFLAGAFKTILTVNLLRFDDDDDDDDDGPENNDSV